MGFLARQLQCYWHVQRIANVASFLPLRGVHGCFERLRRTLERPQITVVHWAEEIRTIV